MSTGGLLGFFRVYWWLGPVLVLVVGAAVRALPNPPAQPKGFWQYLYLWFFEFTHALLSNYDKIKDAGGLKNLVGQGPGGIGTVQKLP